MENKHGEDTKHPNKEVAPPTWTSGAIEFVRNGPMNILLVFAPIAIICWAVHANDIATFVFALLAIMPLAERLGFVTDQLAIHTNAVIGGLLNVTFGNATELIVSVIALSKNYYRLVQLSLLGSVLSNLLLVLGTSFWVGGLKNGTQHFRELTGQINSTILFFGAMTLMFPAVMTSSNQIESHGVLMFSRVTSIFMVILYSSYVYMELNPTSETLSHPPPQAETDTTEGAPKNDPRKNSYNDSDDDEKAEIPRNRRKSNETMTVGTIRKEFHRKKSQANTPTGNSSVNEMVAKVNSEARTHPQAMEEAKGADDVDDDEEEEEEKDLLGFYGALFWLAVVTALVALLSEALVGTIEKASEEVGINSVFVSTIILPIIGNACEHASAIQFAYRDKMEVAVSIAVGSSTQITQFVMPLLVLIAWCSNQPLDLNFHSFEGFSFMFTIILVTFAILNGKSNWLVGVILIFAYISICIGFYFHTEEDLSGLA